jgi:hemoglobin-like flavoprotein
MGSTTLGARKKKVGDNINEDTRPIKLLSALLRAITKIMSKHYQVEISPEVHGYGQFVGHKGGVQQV